MDVGSAKRIGTAFGMRVIRTFKKGQLPLLLLFFRFVLFPLPAFTSCTKPYNVVDLRTLYSISCVLVFFGALTGYGYVDPDSANLSLSLSTSLDGVSEFVPGQPVFDKSVARDEESRLEKMRRLEEEWGKQKRPKDVSYLKKENRSYLSGQEQEC